METKSYVITYDTLFDLLKREKERPDLQKLEPTFFNDFVFYLKQKIGDKGEISARQAENIKKIAREFYDRREKKIVSMALDKSRTKSNLVDTSSLLHEEKVIFESIVGLLDHFRRNIIECVLSEKDPLLNLHEVNISPKKKTEEKKDEEFKTAIEIQKSMKTVRFVNAVPKFVGTELEEYGPFQEEDIAKLPSEIAEVLISKGRAEIINES